MKHDRERQSDEIKARKDIRKDLMNLLKDADLGAGDTLTFQEFFALLNKHDVKEEGKKEARVLFDKFDADSSGTIEKNELKVYIKYKLIKWKQSKS